MIDLIRPNGPAVELIFCLGGQKTLDAYPELSEHEAQLATFAALTPHFERAATLFIDRSLAVFSKVAAYYKVEEVNWEFLRKEFRSISPDTIRWHPKLEPIVRLFAEEDTTVNRVLILLKIWDMIRNLSKFTIRDPQDKVAA